ncbi:hypothetical protein KSP40_PGU017419 [Platanthera guangdongensis]|uniref:Uncharacterized protein n=1 Tax=Platanthera guangdongensis TaxID=2320717 RepID=A0ABR2MVI9_9ASPA
MGFVSEFWKVLPSALKDVTENCDDHGKTEVSRLASAAESSTTRLHPLSLGLERGSAWSEARPGARLGLERGSAWSEARPGVEVERRRGRMQQNRPGAPLPPPPPNTRQG